MNCGIYQIVNNNNGKRYVGSSVDLNRRRRDHFGKLIRNEHYNPILQSSFNKHGKDAFSFEILEHTSPDEVRNIEQRYIDTGEFYYNISRTAVGGFDLYNHPRREEIIAQRSKTSTGRKRSVESRKRMSDSASGESNHRFNGYFNTPWGIFPSANQAANASDGLISYVTILDICKNSERIISSQSFTKSKYLRTLDRSIIGKTFRDIGFWFERALKD